MGMILENGDFKLTCRGIPYDACREELIFSAAECLLKMPKGSFIYDPDLGSRLPEIDIRERENPNALALEYAADALRRLPGVRVISASADTESRTAVIAFEYGGKQKEAKIRI